MDEEARDLVEQEEVLFWHRDYVQLSTLASEDGQRQFKYIKVLPRGSRVNRRLLGNIFDRAIFSSLDLSEVFPPTSYSVSQKGDSVIFHRTFPPGSNESGTGVEARFDRATCRLLSIHLLATGSKTFLDVSVDWGDIAGETVPVLVTETMNRGDGTLIASQVWRRIKFSRNLQSSQLDQILRPGNRIVDCRFGTGKCVNYELTSNELPPDEFVKHLVDKVLSEDIHSSREKAGISQIAKIIFGLFLASLVSWILVIVLRRGGRTKQ